MPVVINGTTGITTPTESVATTIGVGGATPSASGAGITFPATQSASSDANTLDDYEEGTWTGALVSVYGSFTSIDSFVEGTYTKMGNLVYVQGIFLASSASAVDVSIDRGNFNGLPFTTKSTNGQGGQPGSGTAMCLNSTGGNTGALFTIGVTDNSTSFNIWGVAEHGSSTLGYLSFGLVYST
jgi:hypothetical protein